MLAVVVLEGLRRHVRRERVLVVRKFGKLECHGQFLFMRKRRFHERWRMIRYQRGSVERFLLISAVGRSGPLWS